MPFSFSSKV